MDLVTGLVAGIGAAAVVQTIFVWRAMRAVSKAASIEPRLDRLADALALLTDTTESAFRAVATEMARTPNRADRIAPAVSAARTRRIARAVTRGASVEQIAAAEEVAESEVRLRLQMAAEPPARAKKPVSRRKAARTASREDARGAVQLA